MFLYKQISLLKICFAQIWHSLGTKTVIGASSACIVNVKFDWEIDKYTSQSLIPHSVTKPEWNPLWNVIKLMDSQNLCNV